MDCDILVIGAGVLGLSSAYHMKRRDPSKKILVIDKFSGPGQGNSAKSEGGFRNVFTSETNYLLADTSIDAYKEMEEQGHDIKLQFIGYLWLFSQGQHEAIKPAVDAIVKRGGSVTVLSLGELKDAVASLVKGF